MKITTCILYIKMSYDNIKMNVVQEVFMFFKGFSSYFMTQTVIIIIIFVLCIFVT